MSPDWSAYPLAIIDKLIVTIIFSILTFFYRKKIANRVKRCYYFLKKFFQDETPKDKRIILLDGERKFYKEIDISATKEDKLLIISPKVLPEELTKHNFSTGKDYGKLFDIIVSYICKLSNISSDQAKEIVIQKIEEATASLYGALVSGIPRFNGEMLAPSKLAINRDFKSDSGVSEKPIFSVTFYKTDYFSYTVVRHVYLWLMDNGYAPPIDPSNPIKSVNDYIYLSPSFGLSSFLIFTKDNVDNIVLFPRSNAVSVDPGKWHFSMNEAFSSRDVDSTQDKKLSLSACLERGYEEELGIIKIKEITLDYGFFMLLLQSERFEIGICSFIRITLNENQQIEDYLEHHLHNAQDGVFEHGEMEGLRYKIIPRHKLQDFAIKNKHSLTAGCYIGLQRLWNKYQMNYL